MVLKIFFKSLSTCCHVLLTFLSTFKFTSGINLLIKMYGNIKSIARECHFFFLLFISKLCIDQACIYGTMEYLLSLHSLPIRNTLFDDINNSQKMEICSFKYFCICKNFIKFKKYFLKSFKSMRIFLSKSSKFYFIKSLLFRRWLMYEFYGTTGNNEKKFKFTHAAN